MKRRSAEVVAERRSGAEGDGAPSMEFALDTGAHATVRCGVKPGAGGAGKGPARGRGVGACANRGK